MKQIIVGSTAASKYGLSRASPKDIDVWSDQPVPKEKGKDIKIIPRSIIDLVKTDEEGYALPNSLFTIKCSHLGWSNPQWKKHYLDVLFMKQKGCAIEEKLYSTLKEFWKTELGDKSFLSLKENKKDFFTDNVNYIYDHDLLHEKASFPEKPVYTRCLKSGEDVLIDKDKFFNMDFDSQIKMFHEEIHVILFERWIIPNKELSWLKYYPSALEKTITSLTKDWATDFIIRNINFYRKPDIKIINNLNDFITTQEK